MALKEGIIALWRGTIPTIPAGWRLCDGTDGAPDLRDKILMAAGGMYGPDASGGAVQHNHAFTGDGHVHLLHAGNKIDWGPDRHHTLDERHITGTTNNANHLPPYHALFWVISTGD